MGKSYEASWWKHLDFIVLDIISIELAFYLSYVIRFKTVLLDANYGNLFFVIIGIGLLAGFFLDSYCQIVSRGYLKELKQTLKYCAFVSVAIIVGMFVLKTSETYSRAIVLLMFPVSVYIVYIERMIWKQIVRKRILKRKKTRKIFVISTDNRIRKVISGLIQPYKDYELAACGIFYSGGDNEKEIHSVPVVAYNRQSIISYLETHVIDEVFLDLPLDDNETEVLKNILVNMGLVVHQNLMTFSMKDENKQIQRFAGFMVLSSGMKFATSRQLFVKRVMDICGALVGLLITGIAYIIFAPIIKKQSPGPVMFYQERVGRNGRKFRIYKFRTMYPDAEERKKELMAQNKMDGLMFKMDNDPRIIPIGHFLRKSSIDELPQFWNVLKGDMSLVGTRPPTVDEYEQYELHHRQRLAMRPGLTGMWQVSGRSDITDFEEIVGLDAKYISNWNISMDIKILWKTVMIVLGGKGAV